MPKIKNTSKLSNTNQMKMRADEARELEQKKLGIKKEMEGIMFEYAKITGFRKLRARRFRIGFAPNDWREDDHRLGMKRD